MEQVLQIALYTTGAALLIFAISPMKIYVPKEVARLTKREVGVGVMHGMIRRKDRSGVIAERKMNIPGYVK